MTYSVTLELPEPIYQSFKERSKKTHRSLEDELLNSFATELPILPKAATVDLEAYNEVFNFLLSSPTANEIVQFRLSGNSIQRATDLLAKQRSIHGLTLAEDRELDAYVELGDFMDILRAKAMLQMQNTTKS